jgi:ABC-type sugar transport system ATPase subunit
MARALVKEPDILLLDEPISNLDARLKIEIRDEIKRLQQDLGLTAIIVTHDQEEAMAIADKIAVLDKGLIQQFDAPEVLYHNPVNLFVARFMGNPPMNFIHAELNFSGAKPVLAGKDFVFTPGGKTAGALSSRDPGKVKIGVRSHQIQAGVKAGPASIRMKLKVVENMVKELLLGGMVGNDFVRVSLGNSSLEMTETFRRIRLSDDPWVFLDLNDFNVFDDAKGVNLTPGLSA